MSLFKLTHDGQTVMIHDTDVMEPGELDAMKHLAKFGRFGLERIPKDAMPQVKQDVLDDVALEQVSTPGFYQGDIKRQAEQRVQERGLCK